MTINCSSHGPNRNQTAVIYQLHIEIVLLNVVSIAILLNLVSIFTFKMLRRGNDAVFLLCFQLLTFNETSMCITGTVNSAIYCHLYVKYGSEPIHDVSDQIIRMVATSARYYCIYTHHWWLVIITALRAASVSWPLKTRMFLTNTKVYCMYAVCNLLSAGVYPAMYGVNRLTHAFPEWRRLGNYLHMVLSMALPALIVFVLTGLVLIQLRARRKRSTVLSTNRAHSLKSLIKKQRAYFGPAGSATSRVIQSNAAASQRNNSTASQDISQKATRILFLVALSFVVFQTTAMATWLRVSRCHPGTHTLTDEILWIISEKLVYLDCVFNFIVLLLFSAPFREALKKLARRTCSRCAVLFNCKDYDDSSQFERCTNDTCHFRSTSLSPPSTTTLVRNRSQFHSFNTNERTPSITSVQLEMQEVREPLLLSSSH